MLRLRKLNIKTIYDMSNQQGNQNNIEINVPSEVMEGVYSNLAVITHSSAEFIFDFVRLLPGTNKAPVKARVVMAPEHAKRLLLALKANIEKYENSFGEIKLPNIGMPPMGMPGEA